MSQRWRPPASRRWACQARSPDPRSGEVPVILIAAKFQVKPESADRWPEIASGFIAATRAAPRCLWFD